LGALAKGVAFAAGKSGQCGYAGGHTDLNEAKSRALAECKGANGVDCKITYFREGTFAPGTNCTEKLIQLRQAQQPFVVAVHGYGDCVFMEVEKQSVRSQRERDVVSACNDGIGPTCKLYASE
jgi:hypothetical protein